MNSVTDILRLGRCGLVSFGVPMLVALLPLGLSAQEYTFRPIDTVGGVGSLLLVPVELEVDVGSTPVQGFSFGVCHDSSVLTTSDATLGIDLQAQPPDFFAATPLPEGVVCLAVIDFQVASTLGVGTYEVLLVEYETSPTPAISQVSICASIGAPPVDLIVATDDMGVVPASDSATVDTSASVPLEFSISITPQTVSFDAITGDAEFSLFPVIEQTVGTAGINGLVLSLQNDPALLSAVGAVPAPPLPLLNGGSGPEFFMFDSDGEHTIVEVITGAESFLATPPVTPVRIDFQTVAAGVLAAGATDTVVQLTPVTLSGVPYDNTLTVFSTLLTVQPQVSSASLALVPGPPSSEVLRFGSAGLSVGGITVPVLLSAGGDVDGWSFAVCHDPTVLESVVAVLGQPVLDANGGNGPAFSSFEFLPSEGWTVGVIMDFTGVAPLPAGIDVNVAVATYEILDFDAVQTDLDFCEIGTPPVAAVLVIDGEREMPLLVSSTIDIPSSSDGFVRGDANGDGLSSTLTDALFTLSFAFLGGPAPLCLRAIDVDGNATLVPLIEALYMLNYQFLGGTAPPAPFPQCGVDPLSPIPCEVPQCP